MVGVRPFGATGPVTGGGVRAFQIGHPASFGGRLDGMGAKAAGVPYFPRVVQWAVGLSVSMGYRRGATDAIADKVIRAHHRVNEEQVG